MVRGHVQGRIMVPKEVCVLIWAPASTSTHVAKGACGGVVQARSWGMPLAIRGLSVVSWVLTRERQGQRWESGVERPWPGFEEEGP